MHVMKCLCRFEVNEWDGKHSFGIVNESYRFCISKTLNPTMKCKEQSQIVSIIWLSAKMQVNMGIQVMFCFGYIGSPGRHYCLVSHSSGKAGAGYSTAERQAVRVIRGLAEFVGIPRLN